MNSAPHLFTLPSTLTIKNAAQALESMTELEHGFPLRIDGTQVEEITSPGLQLLSVCWHQAKQQGQHFQITNPSGALKDALTCAGLSYLLD